MMRCIFLSRSFVLSSAAVALGFTTAYAGADTITLQQGVDDYSGTEDVALHHSLADTNNGGSSGILQTRGPSGSNRQETSLVRFDLSGVTPPSGQTLQSATLTLTKYAAFNQTDPEITDTPVSIFRMSRDWVEGTSDLGSANDTSGATWLYPDVADTNTTWTVNGARGSGTDHAAVASDTVIVAATPDDETYDWDVTADIEAFQNGAATNNGWVLVTETPDLGPYYRSSEDTRGAGNAAHPQLTLTYAVPEPASLAVLGAGSLLLLSGRRRRA